MSGRPHTCELDAGFSHMTGWLTDWAVTAGVTWYEPSYVTTTEPPGPTCTGKPGAWSPLGELRTSPPLGKLSVVRLSGLVYTATRTVPPPVDSSVPG